jgi:cysteine-rich repeat protein
VRHRTSRCAAAGLIARAFAAIIATMTCKLEVSSFAMIAALSAAATLGCTPEDPPSVFTATIGSGESGDGDEGDPECGDGVLQSGEECDLGPQNADNATCTPSCEIAECGDGNVLAGAEDCDDGNDINTDGCVLNCQLASCGDGFTQAGVEICDDGNSDEADGCTSTCTTGTCADGVIQDGEQCDDGNMITSDDCPACQVAFCGDGYVQQGVEFCDDHNIEPNDACTYPFCRHNLCGDGVLYEGMEECDDGNAIAGDECTATCTTPFCGDGVKHVGVEECDDGNDVDDDYCTNACISLLYFVEGPQVDVDEADLGGWEECWSGTFGNNYPGLTNTILGMQCTGSKLLIGCRPAGASVFTLLAMGERDDVLFNTGQGNVTHDANGVSWYFSGDWSMGFADEGTGVQRNSCDVANVSPTLRMCWHTSGDSITSGYRCGSNFPFGNNWERVIMHAD